MPWLQTAHDPGLHILASVQQKLSEAQESVDMANEILRLASAFFRPDVAPTPLQVVRAFIDQYRHAYGVEPICNVMQVAPSGHRLYAAQQRNFALRCVRVQRDDVLSVETEWVWQANLQLYGADKVWRRPRRVGTDVARCTVVRLMRRAGLRGVIRG